MKITKFSELLALVSWTSVFALGWFFVLGIVLQTVLTWLFFMFFLLVAVLSTAVASKKR